ncbi:TonB-linked SusC/RagA family outer membrane protein [Dyadobacter jejuensis]|uniref:TonB-linked SusC/RagA family outer membrane protein n=1 Tax=Dyadobacter jejuensis TaxID=1082580 RepID=A0A316AIU2_9BACT|nr:SusC/RagA family TonB-linked outer membrane protein [Dyadobacter jejuensis]PWJ57616.1 TonB-linked SusC/RagA family outer membrane protein [Dyadobacter jejuensis]
MLRRLLKFLAPSYRKRIPFKRVQFVMVFVLISIISFGNSFSQVKLTVRFKNASLKEVLNAIEAKTGYMFLYQDELLKGPKKINGNFNNTDLGNILKSVSKQTDVEFELKDKQIILSPKKASLSAPIKIPQTIEVNADIELSGTVTDKDGVTLPGVGVTAVGSTRATITDVNGKFKLSVPETVTKLAFSFVGMKTQEVTIGRNVVFNIKLEEDTQGLGEVVVVGYGVQKKAHVTASVSQVGEEVFENRPVSNAVQALQGAVPNLQISNSSFGGEPGASPSINVRGFITSSGGSIGEASPLVLIDGVEMSLADIDPDDIASVSVLKDAAAAAVYGARAAGGALLVTTKNGKSMNGGMKISYSNNFAISQPTLWPEQVDALTFAYVMNDATKNSGSTVPYYSDQQLEYIQQNMLNPGSAPTLVANSAGTAWDQNNFGLGATGSTQWKDFLFKKWASRSKNNISFTGGNEKLNYYLSTGYYNEGGLLKVGGESFQRFNMDAKIAAKPLKWLSFELLTKMLRSQDEFPWDYSQGTTNGRGRVFDIISKLKPTLPTVDPLYGEPLIQAQYPLWSTQREKNLDNQISILPRVMIEPLKDWQINLQYNYRRNNDRQIYTALPYTSKLPNGTVVTTPNLASTQVNPRLYTNEYFSPNLFTTYTKSINQHFFKILLGYQNELYESYNLYASALNLLSESVPSISTAVGNKVITDGITHWATRSVFSRLNYNYKEKYFLEVSYRKDGSSKFEPGKRTLGFPSFSAGYDLANEAYWPLKDKIQTFKLRGSYGTLGNQNVENYLYVPTLSPSQGTYLFNGSYRFFVNPPSLTSVNLTWETVQTTDFGVDLAAFKNRLNINFDWYRSDIDGMAAPGQTLPAVLGTDAPRTNVGRSRVQGWETEVAWQDAIGEFKYNVKAVLSDYKRSIVSYPNATNLLSDYYAGQDLGDVYGFRWAGWFQSADDVSSYAIDQSSIANSFNPGDTKFVDINNDGKIDRGTNTLGDSGDLTVVANTTPRYQYSFTIGGSWKGFDLSMYIQGVGKRDVLVSNHQRFRGPAQGPLHANVLAEHLDYWRDETSPLGANYDAYFPKPYAENPGRNVRNYPNNAAVDRYIQDGSYIRLKNLQIGYTLPTSLTKRFKVNRLRVFVSGENLLTSTDYMFYDPETTPGNFGSAYSYPLAKVLSTGLNVSF